MPLLKKREVVKDAGLAIGRALRDQYRPLTREALPTTFTALLVRLESAERIARMAGRVERLRNGLSQRKKE